MALAENLAVAAYTVLALALAVIAGRAWRHSRNTKIGFLGLAFTLFFLKGVALTVGLFRLPEWKTQLFLPLLLMDLVALAFFYGAVLKRGAG